jgi:NAD(P)-dependent dehydrogenase (short-subunit alcohol dehydrogenase family)
MKLRDQVALVTGGGKGIGGIIISHLSDEGAKVAINDVDSNLAKSVSQELKVRPRRHSCSCGYLKEWTSDFNGGYEMWQTNQRSRFPYCNRPCNGRLIRP